MAAGDRVVCAVQNGMARTEAIVRDGMNEVKGAAAPAREILQRFLDAGEIRIGLDVSNLRSNPATVMFPVITKILDSLIGNAEIVIPIPPKKGKAVS